MANFEELAPEVKEIIEFSSVYNFGKDLIGNLVENQPTIAGKLRVAQSYINTGQVLVISDQLLIEKQNALSGEDFAILLSYKYHQEGLLGA